MNHAAYLLERRSNLSDGRAPADSEPIPCGAARQSPSAAGFQVMNRRVLERVIAPSRAVEVKGPKSRCYERKINQAEEHEKPRQQEHNAADRVRRGVSKYQRSQDKKLHDERHNRSPKKPSCEPVLALPEQCCWSEECRLTTGAYAAAALYARILPQLENAAGFTRVLDRL